MSTAMFGKTATTVITFFIVHLGFTCEGVRKLRVHEDAADHRLSETQLRVFSELVCNFTARYFEETMVSQLGRSVVTSPLATMMSYAPFALFSEGNTHQEIIDVFGLDKIMMDYVIPKVVKLLNVSVTGVPSNHSEVLELVTAIYVNRKFHVTEKFNDTMVKLVGVSPETINFADPEHANVIVNSEVANRTHNLIKHLTNAELFVKTASIISISSLYFRGFWFSPFPEHRTKPGVFHSSTGGKAVTYMEDYENESYEYGDDYELDCKILIKRYINYHEFGVMFFLPNRVDGLRDLIAELVVKDVLAVRMERLPAYSYVNVTLPKFELDVTWNVTGILNKMGINEMYSEHAKFHDVLQRTDGDMADHKVRFSGSYQGTKFGINETGSDAAVTMRHFYVSRRMLYEYYEFNADHSFVFVVFRHYLPLYIGVFDG